MFLQINKNSNKKGVSIIIGYVLLVTFAIIISVVVFQWLRTYVPTEGAECPDGVSFYISDYNLDKDNNELSLTLRNNGRFNIEGIIAYYSDGASQSIATKTIEVKSGASKFGAGFLLLPKLEPNKESVVVFDTTGIANIYSIEITPTRQQEENNRLQSVICTDAKTKKIFVSGVEGEQESGEEIIEEPTPQEEIFSSGSSILFDGLFEYINVDGVLTPLASTTTGTWSAWVKSDTPKYANSIIAFGDTDLPEPQHVFFYITKTGQLGAIAMISEYNTTALNRWELITKSPVITKNIWTHVALVHDGNSPAVYVNGFLVDSNIAGKDKTIWMANLQSLDKGRIGDLNSHDNGEANFFNGTIDEVSLFNADLTANEILEIYSNGKPADLTKHSRYNNLVSWFRMGEAPGDTNATIKDIRGGRDGVGVNLEPEDIVDDAP